MPAPGARVVVLHEVDVDAQLAPARRRCRSRPGSRARRRGPRARSGRRPSSWSRGARHQLSRAPGRTGARSTRGTRRSGSAPTTIRCRGTTRRSARGPRRSATSASQPSAADLVGGERVAAVVAGAVGDVLDQRLVAAGQLEDRLHRPRCSAARRGRRRCRPRPASPRSSTMSIAGAEVLDEEPVADLHAVAVDGQRVAGEGVEDAERDQLLGVLARAVVVRGADDQRVGAVGVVDRRRRSGRRRPSRPSTATRARAASPR